MSEDDLNVAQEMCTVEMPSAFGCSGQFVELATMIMEDNNIDYHKMQMKPKDYILNYLLILTGYRSFTLSAPKDQNSFWLMPNNTH